ncbi:MFS transporter [Chitinimonas sp. BJYL2]|uniref:MFS transporter n=1 Tax=Chitinimonas sp. BJYL2 TaxID=2976696 RepID=UPI0022B50F95|nr:MFS transporter [Chitinimonas sp. BJYL2]
MPLFDRQALLDDVPRREVLAWASYDFANSGYTTVVLTAVFNAYFVGVIAAHLAYPTLAWTLALAASSALAFFLLPAIGVYADLYARKKQALAVVTVGCVAGTAALALTDKGDMALAVGAIIVSNFCFQAGIALNSAFLPELAKPETLGKVSGWGWSFGYLGGLFSLALCLGYVLSAQAAGASAPQYVPITMLIVAAVYAISAIPMFVWLRERAQPQTHADLGTALSASFRGMSRTLKQLGQFRDFGWLLLCGLLYQAGIAVVIALAAIYAQEVMHFTMAQTMMLILLVNITASIGAFVFGYVQDRLGHRPTLAITLIGWIGMVLIAATTSSVAAFWLAANLAGLCMGASQSAGRALVGYFAPADRRAEFYGLWNAAMGLAAIIGPPTYGLVTWITHNDHRLAILISGLYFVLGLLVLAKVNVARGRAAVA